MELLVESSIVYTSIWVSSPANPDVLSVCIRPSSQRILGFILRQLLSTNHRVHRSLGSKSPASIISTLRCHPLANFTLIALDIDKIHHARGPDILSKPDGIVDGIRRDALPASTSETDIKRGRALSCSPTTAYPMRLVIHSNSPTRRGRIRAYLFSSAPKVHCVALFKFQS